MPQVDWNLILTSLLYAALTGVFNLAFAKKSQINAWCEANPKLAALFKFTRMVGLDPQHGWALLTLLVKKRLPKVQTEPLEAPAPKSRAVPPVMLVVLCLLLVGCASAARLPCDEAKLRAIDADYVAQVTAVCLPKHDRKEDCPEWPALKVEHKRRLAEECGVAQ
jgi:hypothetical protein